MSQVDLAANKKKRLISVFEVIILLRRHFFPRSAHCVMYVLYHSHLAIYWLEFLPKQNNSAVESILSFHTLWSIDNILKTNFLVHTTKWSLRYSDHFLVLQFFSRSPVNLLLALVILVWPGWIWADGPKKNRLGEDLQAS